MRSIAHVLGTLVLSLCLAASICPAQIALNSEGYFEGPGFRFLNYHNTYIAGRQGGLQMLLHGTRVLDAGNILCETVDGKKYGYYSDNEIKVGERQADLDKNAVVLPGEFQALGLKYDLTVVTDGESITAKARLDEPIDWEKVKQCALRIEIFPEAYFNKTYSGGGVTDYFRERHMGRRLLIPSATRIVVAPEDPLLAMTLQAENSTLSMRDERRDLRVSGYMVFASLQPGSEETEFALTIAPKLDPSWRRFPVIQFSQLGYHPAQRKVAVLELDSRTEDVQEMRLVRVNESGILETVKSGVPVEWGPLYDYKYYEFDFTGVESPGQYFLKYADRSEGPFRIGTDVYEEAWHPTMDVFFPAQMCHVKVRDYLIVWKGACHVEDALHAPPNQTCTDGYRQGPAVAAGYEANQHVPGFDWGGWHDAGDFDMPTGAVSHTTLWMALAQEEFPTSRDVTSVSREQYHVELFQPDGKNDMLQQISYGMEYLLAFYRAFGHIGTGIIAKTGPDYGRVGDPASITDGLIYDASLKPNERKDGRSGNFDDRWVFTDRNTAGQYQFVQVAALASKVLRGHDDKLAEECLDAAQAIWTYEQTHEPVSFGMAYQPQEDAYHSWELAGTVELFLATGDKKYEDRLLELLPSIEGMPARSFGYGMGYTLLRASRELDDERFRQVVHEKSTAFREILQADHAKSPHGANMPFHLWGNNWDILQETVRFYYFIKHFPDLYDAETLYSGLHYNFGCHPATNHSYVSGVGAKSATIGFGYNRNDSTYIPGGVVSGASLVHPKFPDYRERPWDWYQTEYVIQGSAAYVFDVLAADRLLNGR